MVWSQATKICTGQTNQFWLITTNFIYSSTTESPWNLKYFLIKTQEIMFLFNNILC